MANTEAPYYLGDIEVESLIDTPYENFGPTEWAMEFLELGQIDGEHHKTWVLDQVARVLKGTPVLVRLARWEGGYSEYRCSTGDPSQDYLDWVNYMRDDDKYNYDEGTAP